MDCEGTKSTNVTETKQPLDRNTRFAFYLADPPHSEMIRDLWLFGNMFFSCPTV